MQMINNAMSLLQVVQVTGWFRVQFGRKHAQVMNGHQNYTSPKDERYLRSLKTHKCTVCFHPIKIENFFSCISLDLLDPTIPVFPRGGIA